MDRGAWWAMVCRIIKSWTLLRISSLVTSITQTDFPGGSDGKASVYNAGDLGSIPGSGSSLEKEKAYIKLLSNPEIVLLVIFPKEIKTLT